MLTPTRPRRLAQPLPPRRGIVVPHSSPTWAASAFARRNKYRLGCTQAPLANSKYTLACWANHDAASCSTLYTLHLTRYGYCLPYQVLRTREATGELHISSGVGDDKVASASWRALPCLSAESERSPASDERRRRGAPHVATAKKVLEHVDIWC